MAAALRMLVIAAAAALAAGTATIEARSCHDEDVQAKTKAFHEVKQRQEHEAKALQELENAAKKRADEAKQRQENEAKALQELENTAKTHLNHAELVGRLEKAKAEMEVTEQPQAAKEAVPQLTKEGTSPEDVRRLPFEDSNSLLVGTRTESPCSTEMEAKEQPETAKEAAPQLNEGSSPEDVRCLPLEDSNLSLDSTHIESPCATELEAKEQLEAAEAAPQLKKEGASPEDVRCLPLEDSNLSLDSTRIESPSVSEIEDQPEAAKEAAPQVKKEGASPEDVRCWPLEDSNLSLDSTRIESPSVSEMEAEDQPEAAKEAAPHLKKEGTSPEDVRRLPLEDSNASLDTKRIGSPVAAELEAQEQPERATEAAPQLKKEGTSPEDVRCLPLESPYVAASDDAREGAQCTDTPECLTQAMSITAEPPMPYCSLQGVMEFAATGLGVPDCMKSVAEGQHTRVVLQGVADDGVQMTAQPHEKYPGSEPATEAASFKESSAKSSAPEDDLKSSELDERRARAAAASAKGGSGFACKAVLASCTVIVIAILAFHATSG